MEIRKALASDALRAFEIRNQAIMAACPKDYDIEKLKKWTSGELTEQFIRFVVDYCYLAMVNGEIAGTGMLDTQTQKIEAMFVAPEYMGQGVGLALIRYLEHRAKGLGISQLSLDATLNAAPFYRHCGYLGEEVEPYYSPRGIVLDSILMTKTLV